MVVDDEQREGKLLESLFSLTKFYFRNRFEWEHSTEGNASFAIFEYLTERAKRLTKYQIVFFR
jgi:hypothetical protein